MKQKDAWEVRREMLTLGLGSLGLAGLLLVLTGVLALRSELERGLLGVMFLAVGAQVLDGIALLRNRKHVRDEPLAILGADYAACEQCHRVFAVKDMVAHNDRHVCASCKPAFLQKLTEGVRTSDGPKSAFHTSWFWILALIASAAGVIMALW